MSPALSSFVDYTPSAPATIFERIRPAWDVANHNSFQELQKNRKKPTSITDKLLLVAIRSLNESLVEVHNSIMQMTAAEAQLTLTEWGGNKLNKILETNPPNLPEDASEIEKEMFLLIRYLVEIVKDLRMIADDTPVDEDSEDYQDFIGTLVAESEASPAKHGRKALFDLFKD